MNRGRNVWQRREGGRGMKEMNITSKVQGKH
jgi:hypothetical protein